MKALDSLREAYFTASVFVWRPNGCVDETACIKSGVCFSGKLFREEISDTNGRTTTNEKENNSSIYLAVNLVAAALSGCGS